MVWWDTRMLLSSGYCVFSHPEICSGDQSNTSLPATISRNLRFPARRHLFARNADFPGLLICIEGTIGRTATVACPLSAHR